jgi:hypothetical protein
MHISTMRTTVTLDQDAYELACLYAKGRGTTMGDAIGELMRRGHAAPPPASKSSRLVRASNGLLVIRSEGPVITNEMVKAALEEELE